MAQTLIVATDGPRQIGIWGGGRDVTRVAKKVFRYAGVAVQYFASVVVIR